MFQCDFGGYEFACALCLLFRLQPQEAIVFYSVLFIADLYLLLVPKPGLFYIIFSCVNLLVGAAPNMIVFKRQRVRLLFLLGRIARGTRNGVVD